MSLSEAGGARAGGGGLGLAGSRQPCIAREPSLKLALCAREAYYFGQQRRVSPESQAGGWSILHQEATAALPPSDLSVFKALSRPRAAPRKLLGNMSFHYC